MEFLVDNTLNKLKLLFIMDKMEIPLTENSIIDICTSRNNWLNYMDCKEILWQLIEVGFILKTEGDHNEETYSITYDGRNCLSHFFQRIPQSLREEITNFARDNRMNFKRTQEYVGEYIKNEDGSYTVILRIREPMMSNALLEIKLKAPTRHIAIATCKNWRNVAPNTFEFIYDTVVVDL